MEVRREGKRLLIMDFDMELLSKRIQKHCLTQCDNIFSLMYECLSLCMNVYGVNWKGL